MESRSLSSVTVIRFTLALLISLLAARADFDFGSHRELSCIFPVSTTRSSCSRESDISGCKLCAGKSNCCVDSNSYFGSCDDSNPFRCPDGNEAICGGGNCPPVLSCKFINCPDSAKFCWGSTVCDDETVCSDLDGIFCSGDKSNPKNFSVCCASQLEGHAQGSHDSVGLNSSPSIKLTNSAEKRHFPYDIERILLESASTTTGIWRIYFDFTATIYISRHCSPTESSFYVFSFYS